MEFGRESVSVDVELRVQRQFFILGGVVLVAFDPVRSKRPSEFFVKVANH